MFSCDVGLIFYMVQFKLNIKKKSKSSFEIKMFNIFLNTFDKKLLWVQPIIIPMNDTNQGKCF